jgi:polyhydroxybutyrate depolymerase
MWGKPSLLEEPSNGCDEGQPWGEHCTIYPSKTGTPVVAYIHPGGHQVPEDAQALIVKFFKEQVKP